MEEKGHFVKELAYLHFCVDPSVYHFISSHSHPNY